jgi:predicted nucleic acid-binding protein
MANTQLVDTDVMVDFLRGNPHALKIILNNLESIALSSIVVAELYAGVKGEREMGILGGLISVLRVIPVTKELAKSAGLLKMNYMKTHGVGLADAIIAATTESENASILTLNTKHYPMIKGLKPAYNKS